MVTIREVARKYRCVLVGGAVLVTLGAIGHTCYSWIYPPPFQLGDRIHPGMRLGDVQDRAKKLGFEWRVNERTLMKPEKEERKDAAGHIICHYPDALVCENFADVTSFGVMVTSHSCHIVMKADVVDQVWLYMD